MRIVRHLSCFWLLYLLQCGSVGAQCALQLDAGPDIAVCSSEQPILDAKVEGAILSTRWMPETGLDSPISLHPTIVAPFNTTYQLTARVYDEQLNLLTNGDFEQGDVAIQSQYEADSNKPGGYIIGKLGTELFAEAKACEDRTTGTGNMMMVKISDSDNLKIWCQEVTVQPQRDYHFVAFATGLRINNPPVILLSINDQLLSSGTLGSFACSWQRVKGDWNSGSNTTAEICLRVSEEDIGAETDFALDDLGFYQVCELRDEVAVSVIPLEINLDQTTATLPCGQDVVLEATVNSGVADFSAQWSTADGNILSGAQGLQATVDAPGTYQLEVAALQISDGCREQAVVTVREVSQVELTIAEAEVLHCGQTTVDLIAGHPPATGAVAYEWSLNSLPIINSDTPVLSVDRPGIYRLTLTELDNGCNTFREVEVLESRLDSFSYRLELPDCERTTGGLFFGNVFGGTTPYIYSIDAGATFVAEPDFPELEAGSYTLVVQDSYGCELEAEIEIPERFPLRIDLPPTVVLEQGQSYRLPAELNLAGDLIESISWTPVEGLSCTDCLQPEVEADRSVSYRLTIEDRYGCTASRSIRLDVREPSDYYIPTAFSPNEDGVNDRLVIYGDLSEIAGIRRVVIFDRYGQPVFEARDLPVDLAGITWDGTRKGRAMPVGVYVYLIEMEYTDGRVVTIGGEVTLLR